MSGGFFLMVPITFDGPKEANVESDLVRSGGRPHIKIRRVLLLCVTVQPVKSRVWKLILQRRIAKRLVFATSNVTKVTRTCGKPMRPEPNSPANSDVTWRYFFYNLLEFSTPLDCKGSRVVYTSPINTKKMLLCSQLDIT